MTMSKESVRSSDIGSRPRGEGEANGSGDAPEASAGSGDDRLG